MALKIARFLTELRNFGRVVLDTSVLIYHLNDTEPYSELTEAAFGAIAGGSPTAVLSTISITEVLVKPYADRRDDQIEAVDRFVQSLPNTRLVPPGYDIAREAARLRAGYGLRVPDALLLATALQEDAQAFLTNDTRLRRLKAEGLTVMVLADYA